MKRLNLCFMLALPLMMSACASHTPTQSQHQHTTDINPQCLREYPRPAFTADNVNSPEMTEWMNRMLECQKRHR